MSNTQNIPNESSAKNLNILNSSNQESNINTIDNLQSQLNPKESTIIQDKGSGSTFQIGSFYPQDHWVILESLFQRNGIATKPTNLTLEVMGVYSLPEHWVKFEKTVDTWGYQVSLSEAKCLNGKMKERELTEEEKENSDKKKQAPKVDKKNPEAVKAEEERLKKLQEEKEQKEKEFYDELHKLEPLQQFYKIKEMPTQGDCITFSETDRVNTVELNNESLVHMENAINGNKHNILIEVNKVPPPEDNDKKSKPKGKVNLDEIKPIYSVGLADLSEFYLTPGKKEIILRTPLMLKETYEKRVENMIEPVLPFKPKEEDLKVYLFGPPPQKEPEQKGEKKDKDADKKSKKDNKSLKDNSIDQSNKSIDKSKVEEGNEGPEPDYVEEAHTYIYYKISFSEAINPKISKEEKAEPIDLIKEDTSIKDIPVSAPVEENAQNISKISEQKEGESKTEILEVTNKDSGVKVLDNNAMKVPLNKFNASGGRYSDNVLPNSVTSLSPRTGQFASGIRDDLSKEELDQVRGLGKEPITPFTAETKKEEENKMIDANEICNDFRKSIKIYISSICNAYDEMIGGDSNKAQMARRDKGGSIASSVKKDERDININKFLDKFSETGKAAIIKEKLKKFITRIAIEKYKKRVNINENFMEQKDKFFSELFAYINDEIKLGMDEFIQLRKEDIHEHILSSYESSRKEIMQYAIRMNKEPEEKRLLRLSKEYENLDDLETAMYYYKCRLTLNQNKEAWLGYMILSKKTNNLINVEEALNYCLQITRDNLEMARQSNVSSNINNLMMEEFHYIILLSAVKHLKNRNKDAISMMQSLIDKYELKNTNANFNAFLSFLYKENNNNLLYTKHYEAAKRFKMIELGIDLRKPKFNPKVKLNYVKPSLDREQTNKIWYKLIDFFNKYEFYEISDKLLDFIDEQDKNSIEYLLERSKIFLFFKDNDQVIELCDRIISQDANNYNAWVLRGHAYYFKKNLFDSEESYIKGIKNKPKNDKFDLRMLIRLGIIYTRRKTWSDAKTVFLRILEDSVYHSFAWRYLGFALTNLKEFEAAEEALNEAILLDIENCYSWAYFTMFCISVKRNEESLQCLNELIKAKFSDVEITCQIAQLFAKNKQYNVSINLYRRIINLDKNFIDAYIRLAELYFLYFDSKKKREAIELLKNSLQFATDEKDKSNILDYIQEYENKIAFEGNMKDEFPDNFDEDNIDMSKNSGGFVDDSEAKDNFQ